MAFSQAMVASYAILALLSVLKIKELSKLACGDIIAFSILPYDFVNNSSEFFEKLYKTTSTKFKMKLKYLCLWSAVSSFKGLVISSVDFTGRINFLRIGISWITLWFLVLIDSVEDESGSLIFVKSTLFIFDLANYVNVSIGKYLSFQAFDSFVKYDIPLSFFTEVI